MRPFPWGALDAMSRAEVDATRALRAWAAERVRAEDAARALGALLDARVDVIARRAGPVDAARALDGGVAVVLAPADDVRLARGVVVEVEGALATALVARAVRRAAPPIVDAARTQTPGIAGALAAVVAAAARRVSAPPLRVLAAGPAPAIVRDVARADPDLVAVELTVVVDDEAHLARVVVPRAAALASPRPAWSAAALASLGEARVALAVVACASTARAEDVASLAPGDAWMPGGWPLARVGGGWVGAVALAAAAHDVGIVADLGEDGRLVLRGEVTELGWAPPDAGETMTESKAGDALVEAVGEVPVVVRVEIGTAQMRAREWAALGKGDVVTLGRKIGEHVVLRVGDVAIARGELVEVEGEVAVRIVDRIEG